VPIEAFTVILSALLKGAIFSFVCLLALIVPKVSWERIYAAFPNQSMSKNRNQWTRKQCQ